MTTKADWRFRADFLRQQAAFLEAKAKDLETEAKHYREMAKQAQFNDDQKTRED